MKHISTAATPSWLRPARRGALLLALGGLMPAAWGQSFGPKTDYTTGTSPYGVALGDVNGDSRPDLIVSNSSISTSGSGSSVSVFLRLTTGGFGPKTDYLTGVSPYGVVLGDVNSDGRPDIVVVNYGASGNGTTTSVLLGLAGGGFGLKTDYPTGSGPLGLALGDVNGDGRLDIVTANYGASGGSGTTASVLLGLPTGGFGPNTDYFTGAGPTSVALGDVNGDGRLDLVTSNTTASSASVLLGLATGGFGPKTDYVTGTAPAWVALTDVNGDHRLDIVTANLSGASVSVLLGLATDSFGPKMDYPTGAGCRSLALGDVNGDGRPDIVATNQTNATVSVLPNVAIGGFGLKTDYSTGTTPVAIALGDANSDGRLDIVTANFGSNSASVLLNTGTYTPLATAQPTIEANISLYPNPAHEAFTVQLPADFAPTQAELLNALGQVMRRPAVGGASFQVETSGLAPGIYTLRLHTSSGMLAKRVAVE